MNGSHEIFKVLLEDKEALVIDVEVFESAGSSEDADGPAKRLSSTWGRKGTAAENRVAKHRKIVGTKQLNMFSEWTERHHPERSQFLTFVHVL